MLKEVLDNALDNVAVKSAATIPEADCPCTYGSLQRMQDDICSNLKAEIHMGFSNLLDELNSALQNLSYHGFTKQHAYKSIPTISENQPEYVSEKYFGTDKNIPTGYEHQQGNGSADRLYGSSCSSGDQSDPGFGKVDSVAAHLKKHKFTQMNSVSLESLTAYVQKVRSSMKHGRMQSMRRTVANVIETQEGSISSIVESSIVAIRDRSLKEGEFPDNCLVRFVLGKFFTVFSISVVLANSIWLGYECDIQVSQQGGHLDSSLYMVNFAFTTWFIVELILRIAALRKFFIFGSDWVWKMLDLALVLFSIPTLLAEGVNLTFFRLVRLAKISRALRLIRLVKFVTSLREILFSLFFTLGSLFWCFVAFALISYFFALIFMQWRLLYEQEGVQYSTVVADLFKNTGQTMLALFGMVSGGQDWYILAKEFDKHSDYMSKYSLVFYIFFVAFGVVNVIIGVFCAKATDASNADEFLRTARHEEQTYKRIKDLMQVFHEVAKHGGRIVQEDFEEYFGKPRAQFMLQRFGLELLDVHKIWKLLKSYDGRVDGSVDLPAFVIGMMRLSGDARNTELVMLSMQIEEVQAALLRNECEIHKLRSGLNSAPVVGNAPQPPSIGSVVLGLDSGLRSGLHKRPFARISL